jgi:hypothetical protein
MAILGRFTKQPGETLDYDIDFTDWFVGRSDSPVSHTVSVPAGITKLADSRTGNVVKVTLAGGLSGEKYKITIFLTTNASPALVKEADFIVSVKAV